MSEEKILFYIILAIKIFCLTGFAQSQVPVGNSNYFPEKEWRTSSPEQQGMDSQTLLNMVVVMAGDNGADQRVLKSFIIPSVKSAKPLSPNPALINELKSYIRKK